MTRERTITRAGASPLVRLVVPAAEPAPRLDDAQLVASIRAGDETAAVDLHDRLRPRVERTVRAILGPGHPELDDLAQQTFVEIVLSLGRYRGECALETWAGTIAARTVFKYLRRRKLERRFFEEAGANEVGPTDGASLGRQLVARSLARRVRAHLRELDLAKAEAFLLHDVCGFEAKEVASIAGITETAAHARIARGRRELHARIEADPELRDVLVDMEEP